MRRLWQALPPQVQPARLVLTAPIETYRGYRAWLQEMSRSLPVPEVALVDEPTAAAIGAGLPAGSRVLVVDLGGGSVGIEPLPVDADRLIEQVRGKVGGKAERQPQGGRHLSPAQR